MKVELYIFSIVGQKQEIKDKTFFGSIDKAKMPCELNNINTCMELYKQTLKQYDICLVHVIGYNDGKRTVFNNDFKLYQPFIKSGVDYYLTESDDKSGLCKARINDIFLHFRRKEVMGSR